MEVIFTNYFDVWGNEQDGYEVNDVSRHRLECDSKPDTNEQVIAVLVEADFFHSDVTVADVILYWDEDGVEIILQSNGRPFGRLEWLG